MLTQLGVPGDASVSAATYAGVDGYWVQVAGASSERLGLMLQGGGYIIGSAGGYRAYATEASRVTNTRALCRSIASLGRPVSGGPRRRM